MIGRLINVSMRCRGLFDFLVRHGLRFVFSGRVSWFANGRYFWDMCVYRWEVSDSLVNVVLFW